MDNPPPNLDIKGFETEASLVCERLVMVYPTVPTEELLRLAFYHGINFGIDCVAKKLKCAAAPTDPKGN